MFQDRIDAGLALSRHLQHYDHVDGVTLAIRRGGVPVALPVARLLHLPLQIILSKKIGHPLHKEFAIGAVSLTGRVMAPNAFATEEYIQQETVNIREQLKACYAKYVGDKKTIPLKDKTVIIIDDGVATGYTMLSTIEMIREEKPKKIVVAVPVAAHQAAQKISEAANEFICDWIPTKFNSVGAFYEDFKQVSDEDIVQMLNTPGP